MTPRTRIRHIMTGKRGRVMWTVAALAWIDWDDPLTSGPRVVKKTLIEVEQ